MIEYAVAAAKGEHTPQERTAALRAMAVFDQRSADVIVPLLAECLADRDSFVCSLARTALAAAFPDHLGAHADAIGAALAHANARVQIETRQFVADWLSAPVDTD